MTLRYENLARQKERDARKAAEKALKNASKANSDGTGRKRSVSLPTILPPHAPRLQTAGKYSRTTYAYETPFLVPVPIFFGAGLGLGLGAGLLGCVAAGGYLIDPGSCGGGGFIGGAGCGGVACGSGCGGEP